MATLAQTPSAQLHALIAHFDTAMLITRGPEQLHARPMMIAEQEGDADIWFATRVDSAKAHELMNDGTVSVTLQKRDAFIAISGVAELVHDRARIHRLWKEGWKVWFPDGKDDPKLALVRVRAQAAEYWDMEGLKGLRYVFSAAKAYLQGVTPDVSQAMHGIVRP